MKRVRRYFLAGIATILPIGLTIFIFWFLISRFGGLLSPLISLFPFLTHLPSPLLSLLGFILLVLVTIVIGAFASGILGRWLFRLFEEIFSSLPFVKSIYGSAKKLTETVFVDQKTLKKMVLVEYPRKNIFVLGFLMLEEEIFLQEERPYHLIFLPSTPNPTSGWLIIVPKEEVRELSISVDEGLKLIVSGGIVLTEEMKKKISF